MEGILDLKILCTTHIKRDVSILGCTLWITWITRFPRQSADCSFVSGERSFLQTFTIDSGVQILMTGLWARWINVFRVWVPFKSKNISSLASTYLSIFGKTSTIFVRCSSLFAFFSILQSKSITCANIEASTTSVLVPPSWSKTLVGVAAALDSSIARRASPSLRLSGFCLLSAFGVLL